MNAIEFNAAILGLVQSGIAHGIQPQQIILILELQKADLIREIQDAARGINREILPVRKAVIRPNGG